MSRLNDNNNRQILIIEDQSIVSFSLQKQLKKNGYKVQHIASLDNIAKNIEAIPDLIIADTFAKDFSKIKSICAERSLPIICTSPDGEEKIDEEKELKIIAHFFKPYDIQALLKKVDAYFKTITNYK